MVRNLQNYKRNTVLLRNDKPHTKRFHYHGALGKQTVRNVYMQSRDEGKLTWMMAGRWCAVCGFMQSEELAERQLIALGV